MSKHDLKSPTCWDCAKARGYIGVAECYTVYSGECANCGETKGVSTANDWKRPGEKVHPLAWD